MDIGGMHSISYDRFCGARIDLDIAFSNGFKDAPRIEGRLVEGRIPMDSADS